MVKRVWCWLLGWETPTIRPAIRKPGKLVIDCTCNLTTALHGMWQSVYGIANDTLTHGQQTALLRLCRMHSPTSTMVMAIQDTPIRYDTVGTVKSRTHPSETPWHGRSDPSNTMTSRPWPLNFLVAIIRLLVVFIAV